VPRGVIRFPARPAAVITAQTAAISPAAWADDGWMPEVTPDAAEMNCELTNTLRMSYPTFSDA
jgi:hypothetical protein